MLYSMHLKLKSFCYCFRSRRRAIHNVLRKVLEALGPQFEDSLPSPTNATLTPFNSTIKVVGSKACPDYYKVSNFFSVFHSQFISNGKVNKFY